MISVCRRFALLAVIAFTICGHSNLPIAAQDGLTPPPPRPRKAYSTVDNYKYSHGGDVAVEEVRKPKKRKPKKTTVKKTEPITKPIPVETSAGETRTASPPLSKPEQNKTTIPPLSEPEQNKTEIPPQSITQQDELKTSDEPSSSVNLSAAKLSAIPEPQMPPPPTSAGGFSMKSLTGTKSH
jgi:hypothetical protein